LKTQGRFDAAILNPKADYWQNSLFLMGKSVFSLKVHPH
jgi:hypothetical protein